jgi:ketosteroid isomerase-like protein
MSQENVELVRRFLTRVSDQEIDAALIDIAPDAELDWSGSDAPDSGVYRGRAAWRDWMSGRWEGLSGVRFRATDVIDIPPDRVVAVVQATGRGRASGIDTISLGAGVWILRDGQVIRLTLYQTKDDALKAVGLAE